MVTNVAPFKDLNPDTPEDQRYKAIARHPDRPDLYLWRGISRESAKQKDWWQDMMHVLRLDPANMTAHFYLAMYYANGKRPDLALQVADRAVQYGHRGLMEFMQVWLLMQAKPAGWEQRMVAILRRMKQGGGPYGQVGAQILQALGLR